MRTISKLFARSPFRALEGHMSVVKECLDRIRPLFDALYINDQEGIKSVSKEIMSLEHKADDIKKKIRDTLPNGLFLPVDRRDILNLLSAQDSIADNVEDIAVLLRIRRMIVPDAMRLDLEKFIEEVLDVGYEAVRVIYEIDRLLETSFGGPEKEKVIEMVDNIGTLEWKADKKQLKLAQKLFSLENDLQPVAVYMWMKIFGTLGDIANSAEKLSKMLRMFMSK